MLYSKKFSKLARFPLGCLSLALLHVFITWLCKVLSLCSYHCQYIVTELLCSLLTPHSLWFGWWSGREKLLGNGLKGAKGVLVLAWSYTDLG